MVGAHHRTSYRKLFKKLEILTVPSQYIYIYIYSLMSFLLGTRKNFRLTHQYIALTHEINTIFTGRLLTYLVFRKAYPTLGSEFLVGYHGVLQALRMKGHSLK